MNEKSMTALVCLFVRAYHSTNEKIKVFDDSVAKEIITDEEYNSISMNMTNGIKFFNPNFKGTDEEALKWIVNNQIGGTPLGRSAYMEYMLKNAIMIGTKQYLIFASGYDTYAYRQEYSNKIHIFEIDTPSMIKDKMKRTEKLRKEINNLTYIESDFTKDSWDMNIYLNQNFDKNKISFSSLLGISYYLTKEQFIKMLKKIYNMTPSGSSIVFDYPCIENDFESDNLAIMTKTINEEMKAKYSYSELESILANIGFNIYEHLEEVDIMNNIFKEYNKVNPNIEFKIPNKVSYCLAVKI